jgi:hypothetical protein
MLEKLRSGPVEALVRHLTGKLTFHAGAAGLNDSAVMFVGSSGVGKSTLTASLCAMSGMYLVADDTASIEVPDDTKPGCSIEIVPTQKSTWLHRPARLALGLDTSGAGKVPLGFAGPGSRTLRLAAVVGLDFDPDAPVPMCHRIRGQDAFALLSKSVIRFAIDDPKAQIGEFEQLRVLIRECPVFSLRRRRDLGQLALAVDEIRRIIESGASWEDTS